MRRLTLEITTLLLSLSQQRWIDLILMCFVFCHWFSKPYKSYAEFHLNLSFVFQTLVIWNIWLKRIRLDSSFNSILMKWLAYRHNAYRRWPSGFVYLQFVLIRFQCNASGVNFTRRYALFQNFTFIQHSIK